MSTVDDIITTLDTIGAEVLDAMGETELAKLLLAAGKLVQLVEESIQKKTVNLPVQVAAADIAADVLEDKKFRLP